MHIKVSVHWLNITTSCFRNESFINSACAHIEFWFCVSNWNAVISTSTYLRCQIRRRRQRGCIGIKYYCSYLTFSLFCIYTLAILKGCAFYKSKSLMVKSMRTKESFLKACFLASSWNSFSIWSSHCGFYTVKNTMSIMLSDQIATTIATSTMISTQTMFYCFSAYTLSLFPSWSS